MAGDLFDLACKGLSQSQEPPALIVGRPIPLYEVDLSNVDFATDERLPPADRASLALASGRGAVSEGDVAAFLGLGPELSAQTLRRLSRLKMLDPTTLAPLATRARPVEAMPFADERRFRLTEAGASALASGVRVVTQARPLRLLVGVDPLTVLRVLPPLRYANMKRDPPLRVDETPEVLHAFDAYLTVEPEVRGAMLGFGETLEPIPGGERIAARIVRLSEGATFDVRPSGEHDEAWLLTAWSPTRSAWTAHAAVGVRRSGRDEAHTRPLPQVDPASLLPSQVTTVDTLIAGLRSKGMRIEVPWADDAFPVHAESKELIELLGEREGPTLTWQSLPLDGLRGRVRVRALPATDLAAEDALVAFIARRPRDLESGLTGVVTRVWRELCAFWGRPGMPSPSEARVRERMWAEPSLRRALCAGRLRRDLVDDYAEERVDHA
jgi:hypothetical protein